VEILLFSEIGDEMYPTTSKAATIMTYDFTFLKSVDFSFLFVTLLPQLYRLSSVYIYLIT